MIKLSVIVAVYNVDKYIEKCINSLLSSMNEFSELILVDDGSTDESSEICDNYSKYENIKVIHQKNSGVSVARNTGIENSTGNWITFVDGDDFVEANFIEKIIDCINEKDTDMLVFNYRAYIDSDNNYECRTVPFSDSKYITEEKNLFQKRMISQYYSGGDNKTIVSSGTTWCKVIKKKALLDNKIRFKPGLIKAQDTIFWLNATENIESIYYLDMCLYNYRISINSISSGKRFLRNSVMEFNNLISEYLKFITVMNKDNSFYEALYLRYIQVIMWNIDHNFFNKNNSAQLEVKVDLLKDLINVEEYETAINKVEEKFLPFRLKIMIYFLKKKKLKTYYYVYNLYNYLSKIKNRRK
ncbi:glycosyl transferase family 2 [Finegoldia magna]|uniref:glycosyltransferase n=1 Tax=Finegoldia magna TaxID=1260 RepID=UPI000B9191D9|nr:glycosyltransferase [Finegoldia magna]OXZ33204.1 glycosyl transferase family 2 [Finegoldia magna]